MESCYARYKDQITLAKRQSGIVNKRFDMIEIGGYEFKGPYMNDQNLRLRSGVYVIVDMVDGEANRVLDVGTSSKIEDRVGGHHPRQDCWHEHKEGEIGYCIKYTSGTTDIDAYNYAPPPVRKSDKDTAKERLIIETELFWKYDIPCGTNPWDEKEKAIKRYERYEEMFGPRPTHEL